jgi:hypothetical protein
VERKENSGKNNMIISSSVKTCTKCKKSRAIDGFFHKRAKSPDGHDYYCKPCRKEYAKNQRQSEVGKLWQNEYKKKNADKFKKYMKEYNSTYRQRNAGKFKEYLSEYWKKNAEKIKAQRKASRAKKRLEEVLVEAT